LVLGYVRYIFPCPDLFVLFSVFGIFNPLPTVDGVNMNPLYWITGLIALGLLIYLLIALLKPELFG
jgi:K+-transporting ATPase KdpF subunit